MLIDSCVVFFRLPGPSETSFYEITFVRTPVRQERETKEVQKKKAKFCLFITGKKTQMSIRTSNEQDFES